MKTLNYKTRLLTVLTVFLLTVTLVKGNNFIDQVNQIREDEPELSVAGWMTDIDFWDFGMDSALYGSDENSGIEDWMIDVSFWENNNSGLEHVNDGQFNVEGWMFDDYYWENSKQLNLESDPVLGIEKWMLEEIFREN